MSIVKLKEKQEENKETRYVSYCRYCIHKEKDSFYCNIINSYIDLNDYTYCRFYNVFTAVRLRGKDFKPVI